MVAPKDPVKRAEWIRKQRESHIGKLTGNKNPNYHERINKICQICGKSFSGTPGRMKERVCCSRECQNKYFSNMFSGEGNNFYGKKHTQKVKDIVSKTNTGRQQSEATRKKRSISCKKVEHTEEWRNNQSKSLKGREITWNDKLSAAKQGVPLEEWEGFVTPLHMKIRSSQEYAAWRTAIFERDDYRDWFSGVRGNGNLNVHHVIPLNIIFKEFNILTFEDALACPVIWDINNGVTMIDSNHAAHHTFWGMDGD